MVINNQIKDFFHGNRDSVSSLLIWDTIKTFVRGIFKVAIIKKKRELRNQEAETKKLVMLREEQFIKEPNDFNKTH